MHKIRGVAQLGQSARFGVREVACSNHVTPIMTAEEQKSVADAAAKYILGMLDDATSHKAFLESFWPENVDNSEENIEIGWDILQELFDYAASSVEVMKDRL